MIDLFSDTELQRHSSLAREASDGDILKYLIGFSSYDRTGPMALLMTFAPPLRCLQIFLTCGNMCDAPWPYRKLIADALRPALTEVSLAEILQSTWPEEHAFYTALPDSVTVWRGCESGRERGLHWTTNRSVAEGFGRGKRCTNQHPTLVTTEIPKLHVFAVFAGRQEDEVVLDPRQLRKLRKETL